MALVPFDVTASEWTGPQDLEVLHRENEQIAVMVKHRYQSIDISQTMQDLINCGDMLYLAQIAAGRHSSSEPVLKIQLGYQDLVHDSVGASNKSVQTCLSVLSSHQIALDCFDGDEVDAGVELLTDHKDKAKEMASVAMGLADKVGALKDLAARGMEAVVRGVAENEESRKKAEEEMNKIKAEEANISAQAESLQKHLQQEDEKGKHSTDEAVRLHEEAAQRQKELRDAIRIQAEQVHEHRRKANEKRDKDLRSLEDKRNQADTDAAALELRKLRTKLRDAEARCDELESDDPVQAIQDQADFAAHTGRAKDAQDEYDTSAAGKLFGAIASPVTFPFNAYSRSQKEKATEEGLQAAKMQARQAHQQAVKQARAEKSRFQREYEDKKTELQNQQDESSKKFDIEERRIRDDYETSIREIEAKSGLTERLRKQEEEETKRANEMLLQRAAAEEERAKAAEDEVRQKAEHLATANGALQECVTKIGQSADEQNDLEKAIQLLGTVLHLMGQIKTTFNQVALFWNTVGDQAAIAQEESEKALKVSRLKTKVPLTKALKASAVTWAGLGIVNNIAHEGLVEAMKSTNNNVKNLTPTEGNAKTLRLVKEMMERLSSKNTMVQGTLQALEDDKKQALDAWVDAQQAEALEEVQQAVEAAEDDRQQVLA